jgi:hypothetical protein
MLGCDVHREIIFYFGFSSIKETKKIDTKYRQS